MLPLMYETIITIIYCHERNQLRQDTMSEQDYLLHKEKVFFLEMFG